MLKRRAGVEDDQKLTTQHHLNAAGVGSAVAGVDEVTSDRTFVIFACLYMFPIEERENDFFYFFRIGFCIERESLRENSQG